MEQEKIGKFISKCRKEKKMTQLELANQLGITDRAISHWENGRSMPDVSLFEKLCKILNISVSELLNGERIEKKLLIDTNEKLLVKTIDYSNKRIKKVKKAFLTILIIIITTISFLMFRNDYNLVLKNESPSFMFKFLKSNNKYIYIGPGYKMIESKNEDENIKFGFWFFSWNISTLDTIPPPLTVINKNYRVLTETGSYCIKTFKNDIVANTCGDSISPIEINYKQILNANVNDIISINDESITLNKITFFDINDENHKSMEISSEQYSFKVPNIKGVYYVKLDTISKNGKCWYSFKISIK